MENDTEFFEQTESLPSMDWTPNGQTPIRFVYDTFHVVFKNSVGEIAFAKMSNNSHVGCEVIATCENFKAAVEFIKKYEAENGDAIK